MTIDGRPEGPGRVPGELIAEASRLDSALREQGPGETYLFWELDPPLLSEVGYRLVEFDKEARRESRRVPRIPSSPPPDDHTGGTGRGARRTRSVPTARDHRLEEDGAAQHTERRRGAAQMTIDGPPEGPCMTFR